MPQLPSERETVEVRLPSSSKNDPAKVVVYTELRTGDMVKLAKHGENKDQAMLTALTALIKEWNFTDADDKVVPITEDNVSRLPIEDMMAILNKTKALENMQDIDLDSAKKNKS